MTENLTGTSEPAKRETMPESDELLGNWPIKVQLPVQWGDMDALGHVNHTIYIKWMETARMHYFDACGLSDLYRAQRIGPILAGIEVSYLQPVVFAETIAIEATITRMGGASFDMNYRLTRLSEQMELVARGTAKLVIYDYSAQRPAPMPDALRSKIAQLEAQGLQQAPD